MYEEKISGHTMDRKELQKLLSELQPGDTIYVSDLTRITRSTKDLFYLIEEIKEKQALLVSLKDTWLDLSDENPYSEFLLTVMAGVNQLKRDLIRMRQKGRKFKSRLTRYTEPHKGLPYVLDLYDGGEMTVKNICAITHILKLTLYLALDKRKTKKRIISTKCCDC
ncbi:recombinase family protein [Enterococcus faecalis]|uniref:recombinase family protein n=1 Tax=Enterococcus faecalis TaxID=1351 RepID=UPI002ADD8792|nr:recombinase family protein [Enterococcus faecalis]